MATHTRIAPASETPFDHLRPVLHLARDFDEALQLANDSDFALTGAIVGRQPFGGYTMSNGGTKASDRVYLQHFLVPQVTTENCLRRGFAPTESD